MKRFGFRSFTAVSAKYPNRMCFWPPRRMQSSLLFTCRRRRRRGRLPPGTAWTSEITKLSTKSSKSCVRPFPGLLAPELQERVIGTLEIRQIFSSSRDGKIGGCYVQSGKITRNHKVRVMRDGESVFEGSIASLRRFKDDVREVLEGFECGVAVAGFDDISEGDSLEVLEVWNLPAPFDPFPFGNFRTGKVIVLVGEVQLYLPESRSLKDKRQVLKSLKDRLQNRFNVSVGRSRLQRTMAAQYFGHSPSSATEWTMLTGVISKAIRYIEDEGRVQVLDASVEER